MRARRQTVELVVKWRGLLATGAVKNRAALARYRFHRTALTEELGRRAKAEGKSPQTVRREAVATAYLVALSRARRPVPRITVWFGKRRVTVEGEQIPWRDIPIAVFHRWLRTTMQHELMDDLHPDWRQAESAMNSKAQVFSGLNASWENGEPYEPPLLALMQPGLSTEEMALGMVGAEELLAAFTPRVAALLSLVADGATVVDASRALGETAEWGRQNKKRAAKKLGGVPPD